MAQVDVVFIFNIESTLVTAVNSEIVLVNGAQGGNVFFRVGSSATLFTSTDFQGQIVALASITLQFVAVTGLLRWHGLTARLCQTLMALTSTGIVLGIVSYLLLLRADPESNQPVLALLWFALFGWSLAVDANIYKHALSITMPRGLLIAVLVLAASYLLVNTAF